MHVRSLFRQSTQEWVILLFTLFVMLWRGGKTLESTWMLAFLAVGVTFVHYWLQRKREVPNVDIPMSVWVCGLTFVLWTIVSFVTSSTQNYGLDEVLRDVSLLLIFFWVARRSKEGSDTLSFQERLAMVLTVGVLIACAIGMVVYVLQPVNRFVGSFFNDRFDVDYWPNAWGDMVLLCWPMAVFATRNLRSVFRAIIIGIILGCLFLSYSRGSFLAFAGQAVLWSCVLAIAALARKVPWRMHRSHIATVTLTILIAIATFFVGNAARSSFHDVQSVAAKATFTSEEGNSSVSERRQFWEQAFALSLERPLFGWGPYSFRFIQPRLQTGVYETSDHAHNVFLKLAMERGWPAALLFALFLLLLLSQAFLKQARRVLKEKTSPEAFALAAIIAVTGLLAHNLIDYNMQFVGIALPLWLLLGCLCIPRSSILPRKVTRTVEVLLAVLLACVAIVEGRYLILSSFGRHAEEAGDSMAALDWFEQSKQEVFSRDMHLNRAAILLGDHRTQEARAALEDYLRQNAQDARGWKLLGDAEVAAGHDDKALAAYQRAWDLGKYNYISVLHSMLGLLWRTKDTTALAKQKEEILSVFEAFSEAIMKNSHFIALSGNVEEHAAVAALLQRMYPEEAAPIAERGNAVLQHAIAERERLRTKQQGMLW